MRRFPVLVDGDRTVIEATCVIEYLDLHHPGPVKLIPEDRGAALEVRMLDRFFDNYVAEILENDYGVPADVFSVPSYAELRREALAVERRNLLDPDREPVQPYVRQCLGVRAGPFIAASDYLKIVPDQIRQWVPWRYVVLGTVGYGRSDWRAQLRRHFEVDRHHVVVASLRALADEGKLDMATVRSALKKFGIDPDRADPVTQ